MRGEPIRVRYADLDAAGVPTGEWVELEGVRFDEGAIPGLGIVRACRECGCTDDRSCPGGCSWVELDLCSACA